MRHLRARVLRLALATLCSLTFFAAPGAPPVAEAAVAPTEYQLKAVFLFNFTQFVEWPPEAFPPVGQPLVIGVVGDDPFGPSLDEVVKDEQVQGRPLVVKRFRRLEDVDVCHILFLDADAASRLSSDSALTGRAILTVSDAQRSGQRGVIIQFVERRNRIRLRIDVDAANAAGLTISSKLLRSAEIVHASRG